MHAKKMKMKMRNEYVKPARSLEILDKRERERLQEILDKNYKSGFELKDFGVMSGSEERIWLAAKEVFAFDFSKLPVNSVGLNFGKLKQNNKMRLTIEGAQLVGESAERNVAVVADMVAERFLRGEDIEAVKNAENCEEHNFVIVKKEKGEIIGSALFAEGKLKNFLPKSRRII